MGFQLSSPSRFVLLAARRTPGGAGAAASTEQSLSDRVAVHVVRQL